MNDRNLRRELWGFGVLLAPTLVASALFAALLYPENGWQSSAITGAGSGVVIGGPLIAWLLCLQGAPGRRLRRMPLAVNFVVNGAIISALLLASHYVAYIFLWRPDPQGFLGAPMLRESMAFSIFLCCAISYSLELRRLIGPGVFGAFLVGRYRYPRSEQRLLLLLDLVGLHRSG
ncbi:MAG: hypothetical protein FGM55_01765 [Rhodoferax sp.]|nr:hypothetical protein [Rhodoferax sp.]